MTIKTKLITNVLLTAVIIVGISLVSFSSLRFLQQELADLTEKSTPYQLRTVELQRNIQSCITSLLKVNAARTLQEYLTARAESEITLEEARRTGELLQNLSGESTGMSVAEALKQSASELFAAAETRIKSDITASETSQKAARLMSVSSTRLKELDQNIRDLHVVGTAAFSRALANTGENSARLLALEDLRNHLKELNAVTATAHNDLTPTGFLISKGKIKTLLGRIAKNKASIIIASDLQTLRDDMTEFFTLQSAAIYQKNDDARIWAVEAIKMQNEWINRMILTVGQEIKLASAKLDIETNHQGLIFARANSANTILLATADLTALGVSVTADINRLFNLESPRELAELGAHIRATFKAIHERVLSVERALTELGAAKELRLLHAAQISLDAIRIDLNAEAGIVAALERKLAAIEQAKLSADKLHALVVEQTAKGDENVAIAQKEQEKSTVAVKQMVKSSLARIIGVASVAVYISLFFGFWIYRSIVNPLRVIQGAVSRQQEQGREKAALAEAVASGELNRDVKISDVIELTPNQKSSDEMGQVLQEIVAMSEVQAALDTSLAKMTAALRTSRDEEARRDHLQNGLFTLNTILREDRPAAELAEESLQFMASFLGAGVGILYLYDSAAALLRPLATYAVSEADEPTRSFTLGEGLPGQVALERKTIHLTTVPHGYLTIASALGKAAPLNIVIMPIMHNDTLVGVLELGSLTRYTADDFEFLRLSLEGIAIAIDVNRSHQKVHELLEQTQAQAEELRVQQEELQQTNEELMERSEVLAAKRTPIQTRAEKQHDNRRIL